MKLWQKIILVISCLCVLFTSLNIAVFAEEVTESIVEDDDEVLTDPYDIDNWFFSSNYVWEDENGIVRSLYGATTYADAGVLQNATYYLNADLAALGVGALTAGGMGVAILLAGYGVSGAITTIVEEGPTAYAYLCELIKRGCSYDTQEALANIVASGQDVFSLVESAIADVQAQIDYYLQEFVTTGEYVLHLGDTYFNTNEFTEYPVASNRSDKYDDAGCTYLSGGSSFVSGSWSEWVQPNYVNFLWRGTLVGSGSGYPKFQFKNMITGSVVTITFRKAGWSDSYRFVPYLYNHTVGGNIITQFGLAVATYVSTSYFQAVGGNLDLWASSTYPMLVTGSGTALDGLSIVAMAFNTATGLFDYTDSDGNVLSLPFDPFAIIFGNIGTGSLAGTTATLPSSLTDVAVPPLTFPNVDDETIVVPDGGVIEAGRDIADTNTNVDTPTVPGGSGGGGDIVGFFDGLFGSDSNLLNLFGWLPDSFQVIISSSFATIAIFYGVLLALKVLPG